MKRFLVALFSAALLLTACDKYDDSALQSRMTNLEGRVTDLESKVNGINADLASLQTLVKALQDEITVDVISRTKDGYDITFSDGVTVSISNGEKGDTPLIGVKAENGVFYWTVDGEWLLDAEGERVIVTGAVPQVKIQDGKWFVSYDGKNWQEIGSAESLSGLVVTEDANFVYLTVPGSGTTLKLSKASRFTLDIAALEYMVTPGVTTEIPYSIYGADGTEKLFIQSADYTVTYDAEKLYVTPKEGVISGEVLVMAVRNSDQAVCGVVLSFSEGVLEVTSAVRIGGAGGTVEAFVKTNVDYEIIVPEDAAEWLAVAPATKAVRTDTLAVTVQPNEAESPRTATVEFRPVAGSSVFMTVYQEGKDIPSLYPTLTIAEFLALPDTDTGIYQLTGVITIVRNSVYGNFEMKDETGTIYVYGLKDENGENVFTPLGLEKGDRVTLHGTRNVHNGKVEVANGVYERHVKGEDIPEVIEEVTIAEFLAKPVSTDVWYKLTGKITEIANTTYGNFYMEDETGKVYVYGLTATKQDSNDKSFSTLGLKVGDTVTAIGYRSEYTNASTGETTIEFGGSTPAYYVSHVPGEGGDTPGGGGQEGSVVTIDLSGGYDNAEEYTGEVVGDITVTVDSGSNSNSPKFYTTGSAVRFYGDNSFTLESSGNNIIKVEFEFGSGDGGDGGDNPLLPDTGDYADGIWTGSASAVTFTIGGTKGHRRISTMIITLEE